ncbi:MAG: acylpyruvate hydrolase [Subtercola sp.]|nr:acylpyruvate hydrolase [Subtercola sp.]
MRLGTVMRDGRTQAFKQTAEGTFYLPAADIRALLSIDGWEGLAGERGGAPEPGDLAPPVTEPRAFVCAGLNYADHAREVGKTAPEFPTLFAKLSHTLIGAAQPIELPGPEVSAKVDWEAELVVVIGRRIRNASPAQAHAAILGYTAMNDVSMRDWQKRSEEWFQGKNFDRSTPVGPVIVTADEFDVSAGHYV